MYIVLDYIWNRVRRDKTRRVLVVDEAWYLIKNKDSGAYLHNFAKRARKYQLGLTTITQDVEDFLNTLNQTKARDFLKKNNISYIYWVKPQGAKLGEIQLGLTNIFENSASTIYKVN